MDTMQTREIVLARRPDGKARAEDFSVQGRELAPLQDGCVRVRAIYWAVDPGMRSRLGGVRSYVEPVALGGVVGGAAVAQVLESRSDRFAEGELVTGLLGWREAGDFPEAALKLAPERGAMPASALLGLLGTPGMTAFFGMRDVGCVRAGETVLVTSAAGAVGATAGQFARLMGARVIGVAGSDAKVEWLTGEAGFAEAFNYKTVGDMGAELGRRFPAGIDVLFDNVGNRMVDAALPHMKVRGRIVVCGQTEDYSVAPQERHGIRNTSHLISQRLRVEGLLAYDHAARYGEAIAQINAWWREGRLVVREDISHGFDSLPAAFVDLFEGKTFGRRLVAASRA
jgi:NADPH-dependent curcumin reductase CurA